jgi:hypothetical protein
VAAIVCVPCVPPALAADAIPASRVVRIYDAAGLDESERARAMDDARTMLTALNINVEWQHCDARADNLHGWCAQAPAPGELIVRLVRGPGRRAGRVVLGHALVNPASNHGTLATIFVDRIERIAGEVELDPWLIMGRVMAHEISHLVRGGVHTMAGLMKAVWTLEDLTTCARAGAS